MGSRHKRHKRRKGDSNWLDLDDLIDLEDLLKLGKGFDLEDLFDSRKWRGLKKRALSDAWSKLDSGLPIGLGVAALVAALVFAAGPVLILLAIGLLVFGIGRFAWRAWSGLQQVSRGFRKMFASQQTRQNLRLQELHDKLRSDSDPRTHTLLQSLTEVRQSLEEDIPRANFSTLRGDVLQRVDQTFTVCLHHLELTYELWQSAQRDSLGRAQKLAQRETLIEEVRASVQQLQDIASHLHHRQVDHKTSELRRLRDELEETMRVAKRVEQRTDELLGPRGEPPNPLP